jgi:hypothetical protein
MSTIALPSIFRVSQFAMVQEENLRVNSSPYGGSEQLVDLLNDRWKVSLEVGVSQQSEGAQLEAFINAQRGGINTVNLFHYGRPVPRGTMRGTLTLAATAAAGAASITLTGGAGQASTTLLAGDLVGVGGLLLMVQDNATANGSGVITINITNRLRVLQTSGVSVTWDHPTAFFRLVGKPTIAYVGTQVQGFSADYIEAV